jgi:hypothetical protein
MLARLAKGATAAGGAAMWLGRGRLGGSLLLAGAALGRWAVFRAGFASADDPRYTVIPQRERAERRRARADRPAS